MVSGIARSARLMIQAGVMALGALLVLRGELTSGGMIASSILLSRALAPIEQMLSGWRSLVQASECWQRLKVLLAHAPAGQDALPLAAAGRGGDAGPGHLQRRRAPGPAPMQPRHRAGRVPGDRRAVRGRQEHAVPADGRRPDAVGSGIVRLDGVDIATQSRAGPRSACRLPAAAYRPVRRHRRREHRPDGAGSGSRARGGRGQGGRRPRSDPAPAQGLRHAAGRRRGAALGRASGSGWVWPARSTASPSW